MDISRIRDFLNYIPELSQTPKKLFDIVFSQATYLNATDREQVKKAFLFAERFHHDVLRHSGEPYMIHPVKVLEFLLELHPDVVTMQVALLHDVIEDTSATYEQVKKEFSEEVADLCVALEKVAKVRYRWEERHIETLKKTFLAMGQDLRVIIIKLADRVHNIQTLHYHPSRQKKQRIAEETLKVYVPIAKRLWLYIYQGLLENGAFYQLNPKEYKRISDWLLKNYGDVDQMKEKGIARLQEICSEDGVPPIEVLGRLKSPYRIFTKLQKYNTQDSSKVMDVLAFRVITTSIVDCYSDLGAIHKHFTPIFARMKDYIALPKSNGYKSLHTTVLGMFSFPVEIQIRTEEMDHIANYWVAAHFAYSENRAPVQVSYAQAAWIEKLQTLVQRYQEPDTDRETFRYELDIEILHKNIFVYTPKGDIIELPQESTVLDFAFRVHSDVGLKFKNAIVNNKIVPIDFKLKTGDIVDIQTFKNKFTATRWWLQFLHTPSAKNKLNKFLRTQEKEEILGELTILINTNLQELHLPLLGAKDDKISKQYDKEWFEQMFFKIRDRQLSITRLIRQAYGDAIVKQLPNMSLQIIQRKNESARLLSKQTSQWVVIDGDKTMDVILCPECKPTRTKQIIARSGKDGIKIHTLTCHALETIGVSKLLEAHRQGSQLSLYRYALILYMMDKPGMLLELLKIFEQLAINVISLKTGERGNKDQREIFLTIEVSNPSKVAFVLSDLKNRKKLIKIVSSHFVVTT